MKITIAHDASKPYQKNVMDENGEQVGIIYMHKGDPTCGLEINGECTQHRHLTDEQSVLDRMKKVFGETTVSESVTDLQQARTEKSKIIEERYSVSNRERFKKIELEELPALRRQCEVLQDIVASKIVLATGVTLTELRNLGVN